MDFLTLSGQNWNSPSAYFLFVTNKSKLSHSVLSSLSHMLMVNILCSMPALFFMASVKMCLRCYCEL